MRSLHGHMMCRWKLSMNRTQETFNSTFKAGSALADDGRQMLAEMRDELFVSGVDFCIGQGAFRMAIREGVGDAFLAGGHVLAAKHVKKFHRFHVGGFGLFD